MFLKFIEAFLLAVGLVLFLGAGRSWLTSPHWNLVGAAFVDISFLLAAPDYATRHSHLGLAVLFLSPLLVTIEAIKKYNELRQATA